MMRDLQGPSGPSGIPAARSVSDLVTPPLADLPASPPLADLPVDLPAGPTIRRSAAGDLSISTSVPSYSRQSVFGLPIAACTMVEMVETVEAWVDERGFRSATYVNAFVVNQAARSPELRRLLELNDVNYVDGQSVVWASRLLGLAVPERVATTDLIYPLAQMCARRDFGIYLLGAKPHIVELAAERLRAAYPGLRVDCHDGYFGPEDDAEIVAAINRSGARIVMVGMGDPIQQEWIQSHRDIVAANVFLTCGGLFDWVSGENPRPPQWMVSWGFEWLWRIWLEPRRLAGRYLIGNPEFLARLGLALIRRRAGLRY
jgi:N-acetylglucosaminyldiphosphoundecaprenol N-acetyl-beta-D-mannosaminyltransferase